MFEKCVLALFSVFFEGRRPKIGPFNSVSVLKLIQPSKKEKNVLAYGGKVYPCPCTCTFVHVCPFVHGFF